MSDYIDQVFGPGGLLAQKFKGYETRPGQVGLARAIDEALRNGRHLVGEGPCGTGKSIAYGVPAVYHAIHTKKSISQRPRIRFDEDVDPFEGTSTPNQDSYRVVIATANIALQEQLVKKDLPMLQSLLPWPFSFAILKGRNHYVCENKYRDSQAKNKIPGGGFKSMEGNFPDELVQLCAWKKKTQTGDESELSFVPEPKNWSLMAVGSDDCLGRDCDYHEDQCFSENARGAAERADIVVTNFHMLFAHVKVAIATEGYAQVLPPFRYLIVDEAHDLPDVAREFFGFSRGPMAIKNIANKVREWGNLSLGDRLEDAATDFFSSCERFHGSGMYQNRILPETTAGWIDPAPISSVLREAANMAEQRIKNEFMPKKEKIEAARFFSRALNIDGDIGEAVDAASKDSVYFIEKDQAGRFKICARTIDVGPVISQEVFGVVPSVCLTSATLTTNGNFEFIRHEVGLDLDGWDPIEIIAETPFNFEEQALLVVPRDMPDPKSEEFVDAAAFVFDRVVEYFQGRTLGLFTSYKTLKAVAERLKESKPRIRVMVQGDKQRTELAREFREDLESVLLGTSSFWTGIDVPGESLSAVVIDKLPFPMVTDPVVSAICAADPKSFGNYMIPKATIMLRQGVGRLVRAKTDIGIVVILDPRIADKGYGKKFRRSLPAMRTTRDLDNISCFMDEARTYVSKIVPDHPALQPEPEPERAYAGRDRDVREIDEDEIPF